MSWVTVVWSMIASASLTLAAVHLMIWLHKRTAWASLLFAVTAVATAAMAGGELWLMHAKTAREFGTVQRWSHLTYWVVAISLVAFVRLYLRAGRPWLAWTVCGTRTVSLLINFLVGENLNYRTVTGLGHVHFLGDSVAVAEGIVNPWIVTGFGSLVLLVIFVADATLTVWRRRDRWQLVVLGGAIVCFVLGGAGKSVLEARKIIHQPVTPSLFFLGIIAMMAYDMSYAMLRAADLADDLRESEARMSLAAEAAGFGVWVWSIPDNQIWGSERWLRLFGFSRDAAVSFEMVTQRIHPDDREKVIRKVQLAAADRRDFAVQYRVILPDGTQRWIEARGRSAPDAGGKPTRMLGAAIDITVLRQAEREIERQRNELAHVTRVSTVGQLASSLAHELNQPLGAILRNAEAGELFLRDPSPDLDELGAILKDIREDDQRAGAVIDRMRGLMKHNDPERERLDLRLVLDDTLTLVRVDAERRRVRLALEADEDLPLVPGDRVQLQQVVLNLLMNAMDALDDTPPASRLVTVRARPVGATVEVAVRDAGPGIPAEKLSQVFEPFVTSKPTGLGMGLAISRGIIEAHGGRLWVENNEAGGATFTMTLPLGLEGSST